MSKRNLSRRDVMGRATWTLGALMAAPWLGKHVGTPLARAEDGAKPPTLVDGDEPLRIAMVPYPGFTLLDLVGPLNVLALHGTVHVVAATLDPVPSDSNVAMLPTTTFDRCPRDLDVLFVPGGFGTAPAMEDARILAFLRDRAPHARYVTSVCSGALVLAAAGLLEGYRATTHWATYDALRLFDVDVRSDRVVVDRNRVTGGGVTAGIDFGLTLLSILRDEPTAKMTQLLMEYNPEPPFDAGRPELAGPEITAKAKAVLAPLNDGIIKAAKAAVAKQG